MALAKRPWVYFWSTHCEEFWQIKCFLSIDNFICGNQCFESYLLKRKLRNLVKYSLSESVMAESGKQEERRSSNWLDLNKGSAQVVEIKEFDTYWYIQKFERMGQKKPYVSNYSLSCRKDWYFCFVLFRLGISQRKLFWFLCKCVRAFLNLYWSPGSSQVLSLYIWLHKLIQ